MHAVLMPERLFCGKCGSNMRVDYRRTGAGTFDLSAECFRHDCEASGKIYRVPVTTLDLEEFGGQKAAN